MADLGLADAVDSPKPLLDPVRIPGQVVVDHQVCALEVYALPCSVSGKQHLHFRVVKEAFLCLTTLLAS
jgi:hypothetical protein